jgi:hypothetical protein
MSGETKSAAELAVEMKTAFETKFDAVKAIAEDALGKAKAGETLSQSMKEKADEALTELGGLKGSWSKSLTAPAVTAGQRSNLSAASSPRAMIFCASRTTRAKVTAPSLRSRLI